MKRSNIYNPKSAAECRSYFKWAKANSDFELTISGICNFWIDHFRTSRKPTIEERSDIEETYPAHQKS